MGEPIKNQNQLQKQKINNNFTKKSQIIEISQSEISRDISIWINITTYRYDQNINFNIHHNKSIHHKIIYEFPNIYSLQL